MERKIKYLNLKKVNETYGMDKIQQAINNVVNSGWYLQGEAVKQFEKDYADFIGTKHCISCGSGLDALKLILQAEIILGRLHKGDEIIVPANTFIATILAITSQGLIPILVEPSLDDLQMNVNLIEDHITTHTRAIMAVHLYGVCGVNKEMIDICQKHNLLLFEDNAQAHGCLYPVMTKRTGSLCTAAAHSFYPGKNLGALGDAGSVTTSDDKLAEVIEALHNYGSSQKYVFDYTGRNSRMDEIQAAVLDVKLKELDQHNRTRRELFKQYLKYLNQDIVENCIPKNIRDFSIYNVFHILPMLTPRRDELKAYLESMGVETMIHYPIPPHKQKCYHDLLGHLSLPVTERISREELSLPCNESMTEEDVKYVARIINDFYKN